MNHPNINFLYSNDFL